MKISFSYVGSLSTEFELNNDSDYDDDDDKRNTRAQISNEY